MDASQEAWLLLRGFLALAAVLLLAVVSLRFGLPWLVRQRASGAERQLLVEDVCLLDRNHRLYVVRWKEERLLIATSPKRVELIAREMEARRGTGNSVPLPLGGAIHRNAAMPVEPEPTPTHSDVSEG